MAEQAARRPFFMLFMRYWLPVLAYVCLIITLSAQQDLRPPARFNLSDKVYHMGEYFWLGVLLTRAFRSRAYRPVEAPLKAVTKAVVLGILVAISDEIFQRFIPGRSSDVFDVLADTTGLLCAQVAFLLVVRD